MLKHFCIALTAIGVLVLGGCSGSAADPPADSAVSPAPPPAAVAPEGPESALPATPPGPVGGAPPTLAPVGPIPGPGITGENAASAVQNPYAGDPSALEQGRQLFIQMNCYGCHGGRGGGGMGPSLRDQTWIYGNTPADIFDSISQGRAKGMPAWGTQLPPDVIWKLVTYIQSLRTANEPDPPTPPPAHAPDSAAAPTG
jgi:cytochrome c oxidase cbb3-type subunit 3